MRRAISPRRGSVGDPYVQMPTIDAYDILDKKEAWADNVRTLYTEAKAGQWNSTSDLSLQFSGPGSTYPRRMSAMRSSAAYRTSPVTSRTGP